MTDPDTIASAVINHIAQRDLELPPTDAEVFDGVPAALPEEITEKIVAQNVNDDDWEDAETEVRKVPEFRSRPHGRIG
ncbi:MAG: hypothetical protein AAB554_03380 [Patescibacteria group bacterium]